MTTQQKKPSTARHGFKTGESIVYPAHGVGTITAIEEQEVAGMKLELFVIDFEKDKMRLKVPVAKAMSIGMRKLSETDFVERALKVVQGKARVKRTMWSRRAQEYDAKINSGDLISMQKSFVTSTVPRTSRSSPIQSASFMKQLSTAWLAKSLPSTRCLKPKLFASSRPTLTRVRSVVR